MGYMTVNPPYRTDAPETDMDRLRRLRRIVMSEAECTAAATARLKTLTWVSEQIRRMGS